jgi:hypothetical protein
MSNLSDLIGDPASITVEITNPEYPFGGVLIQQGTDEEVQVQINTGSPVSSVFGRIGAVSAQCSDYAGCYATNAEGVPPGGLNGQVLAKHSDTSFDTEWISGGGISLPITTHLFKGDGAGGAADSGIDPAKVVQADNTQPTPATINQIIALLQHYHLCA